MEGCKKCKEPSNLFDTIGKTYYRLKEDDSILCYRHWYQTGRPEFKQKGEYNELFSKSTYIKKI